MIKICPECLNINNNTQTCKHCGFPLNKKILGEFEEYRLHKGIELINEGKFDEAYSYLNGTQPAEMTAKLSVLKDKLSECQSLIVDSKNFYNRAKDLFREGSCQRALEIIDKAIEIQDCQEYIDLRNDIIRLDQTNRISHEASALFNQGQTAIKLNEIEKGLRLIKQAIQLDPSSRAFLSEYQKVADDFVKGGLQRVTTLVNEGDFSMAEFHLNEIRPYAGTAHNLLEYEMLIEHKSNRRRRIRRLIKFCLIFIPLLILSYFGWIYLAERKSASDWKSFCSTAKISDYQEYIKEPSNERNLDAAMDSLNRILELDSTSWVKFLRTKNREDALAYIGMMSRYGGFHIGEAESAVDSLDWIEIANSNDPKVFDEFIRNHPNSKFLDQAIKQKESQLTTAQEREFATQFLSSFFSIWSDKNVYELLSYFSPVTSHFQEYTNLTQESLHDILVNELRATSLEKFRIDMTSFEASKNLDGSISFFFLADVQSFEPQTDVEANSQGIESYKEFFSNIEYRMALDSESKIRSFSYRVLSKQPLN